MLVNLSGLGVLTYFTCNSSLLHIFGPGSMTGRPQALVSHTFQFLAEHLYNCDAMYIILDLHRSIYNYQSTIKAAKECHLFSTLPVVCFFIFSVKQGENDIECIKKQIQAVHLWLIIALGTSPILAQCNFAANVLLTSVQCPICCLKYIFSTVIQIPNLTVHKPGELGGLHNNLLWKAFYFHVLHLYNDTTWTDLTFDLFEAIAK